MSFNINRFKENLNSYGYVKNNKFEVFVQSPKFLQNKYIRSNGNETNIKDLNELLRFRIDQTKAPGVSLLSIDTNRYGIGPTQKMPYNAQFFDTFFNVLLDKNTYLWDFWYVWTNTIFNFNGEEPGGNNTSSSDRIPSYTLEYKDEYTSTMMIVMYDDQGNAVKTINLYEAFPSAIKEVPLTWSEGSLVRLSVSITYSNYSIVETNLNSKSTLQSSGLKNSSITNINLVTA